MENSGISRPTILEVNLDNIAHNIRELKEIAGKAELMAVVKANAYGHGVEQVSNVCLKNGATWLGVATLEEGIELREKGFKEPILVFGGLLPGQLTACSSYNIDVTIQDKYFLENLRKNCPVIKNKLRVHLKIDTGMHRLGIYRDELRILINELKKVPEIDIIGIWTHFPEAGAEDRSFTEKQIKLFKETISFAENILGREIKYKHAANSAAIINHRDSHFNLVRPGLGLYGYYDGPNLFKKADLIPAARWISKIVSIRKIKKGESVSYGRTYFAEKDMIIATIPAGYADGYNRLHSNCGYVLLRGKRVRIAGRVCMDQLMIDVSEFDDIRHGEEVVLLGKQGSSEITIYEMMSLLNTIPNEILVNIGKRVKRIYR